MIEQLSFTQAQCFGRARNAYPFTKYVSIGGTSAGDGSFFLPFATVAQAVASINNAGTAVQPWLIDVGPGQFALAALDPYEFVVGAGRNATTFTSGPANLLSANFNVAGTPVAAIIECAIGYALTCDFAAVTSATGAFFLFDSIFLGFASTWTANGNTNLMHWQNVCQISTTAGITHTVTNFNAPRFAHVDFRGNSLTFIHNLAFASVPSLINCLVATLTVNCANAAPNTLTANILGSNIAAYVFTGDGAFANAGTALERFNIDGPDADTTFTFNTVTAGATHLLNIGRNLLVTGATVNRTYTFNIPSANTELTIFNPNGTAFVNLVYTGSGAGRAQTYVGPGEVWQAVSRSGTWFVLTRETPQLGRSAFVAGLSPFIPCDIVAGTSSFSITNTLLAGAAIGLPVILDADIVTGSRAGGGGFRARSMSLAGVQVATDGSSFAWTVSR